MIEGSDAGAYTGQTGIPSPQPSPHPKGTRGEGGGLYCDLQEQGTRKSNDALPERAGKGI